MNYVNIMLLALLAPKAKHIPNPHRDFESQKTYRMTHVTWQVSSLRAVTERYSSCNPKNGNHSPMDKDLHFLPPRGSDQEFLSSWRTGIAKQQSQQTLRRLETRKKQKDRMHSRCNFNQLSSL